MKATLVICLLLSTSLAFSSPIKTTEIFSCKTTKVLNDNVFEEGLSVEEYPDVTLDSKAVPTRNGLKHYFDLYIGSHSFTQMTEPDVVIRLTMNKTSGQEIVTVEQGDAWHLQITVSAKDGNRPRRGAIYNINEGQREKVAEITCR